MRENLLGYLLGALDASERAEVEQALSRRPELRQQLEHLRRRIRPLERFREEHEPPEGLASRTCCLIDDALLLDASDDGYRAREPLRRSGRMSPAGDLGAGQPGWGWSLADMVVAAGVFLAASLLFFPIIASSRMAARIAGCQNNLRILGIQQQSFSDLHGNGRFPYIPPQGHEAYAGFYSTQLAEHELLPDESILICPTSRLVEQAGAFFVPGRELLRRAEGEWLARLQKQGGGSYASPLGVVVNGLYQAPRNRGRAYFPLMADAPNATRTDGQEPSLNHGGVGHNVLFEDGHVVYVKGCLSEHCGDDPLVNDLGRVEAGRSEDDAILAPSETAPFIHPAFWQQ